MTVIFLLLAVLVFVLTVMNNQAILLQKRNGFLCNSLQNQGNILRTLASHISQCCPFVNMQ